GQRRERGLARQGLSRQARTAPRRQATFQQPVSPPYMDLIRRTSGGAAFVFRRSRNGGLRPRAWPRSLLPPSSTRVHSPTTAASGSAPAVAGSATNRSPVP